jgi:TonB-dependent starch-binding outer membrane protein SusC
MKIKVNFKSWALLSLFMTLCSVLSAQKTITGSVLDADNGESLVGAAVVVTGTTKGTLTDVDGKYELQVPNDATTLTFSYTGYASLTIPIGNSKTIDAKLKGNMILEQVVVVGYGSLKSKEVTSSITSVKEESFNKGAINDPVQLLQGKVAGLSIANPQGNPNGGFDIRLRGVSTIGGNVQPLVVVDGVPGVDLKLVNPADIESFDVLKDGSASAIYGASASSGVILITTKKGSAGRSSVEYGVQVAASTMSNKPALLSADEFVKLGGVNLNSPVDWYKEISRTGVSQIHNLSLSGGVNKTNYRVSLNFNGVQGVLLNDGFDQLNGRFNVSQKALDDRLTVTLDGSLSNRDATIGFSEAFYYAQTHNPTAPIYDNTAAGAATGGFYQISGFDDFNPLAIVKQSTNEAKTKNLFLSGKADLEIVKGLKLSGLYSITRNSFLNGQHYSRLARFIGADANGLASRYTNDLDENYFNSNVNYSKDLGKLNLNAVAGYDYRDRTYQEFGAQSSNVPTDVLGYNSLGSGRILLKDGSLNPNLGVGSFQSNRKLIAFFGRVGFNYDDTYFAQVTVRREGSTMFGPNNKWGVFPGASAGVALNKVLGLSKFQQLKLRVGYGVTGALPPGEYLSQTTYRVANNGGINSSRNGNPDLKWEQKAELSAGLDFVAMDGRLNGTLEYYNRNIEDMLYFFSNTAAGLFEQSGIWANAGVLNSSGFEAAVGYQILKPKDAKSLSWRADFNLATNESVIKSINTAALRLAESGQIKIARIGAPGLNDDFMILVQEGKPVGQIWTLPYAGVNDKGQVLVKNKAGQNVLTSDGTDEDRVVVGTGLPKVTFGLTNSFNFGNFDFNFFLRGVLGHYIVNEPRIFYENAEPGSIKAYNRVKTKYWDEKIKEAKWTDRYVEKGDFLRLDNVTLGYTLPAAGKLSKLRLFVNAQNLATITGYTGVNPEVRYRDGVDRLGNGGDPLAPGIERRNTYYLLRTVSVGLNVGF